METARNIHIDFKRWEDRHLGSDLQAHEFRSGEKLSGGRIHLFRAARLVRADRIQRQLQAAHRIRFQRDADRRNGHKQPLQTISRCRVEKFGRRWFCRPHPMASRGSSKISLVMTSHEWGFSEIPLAARTRWEPCSSIPNSIELLSPPAGTMITEWIRSGGTSSG